MKLANEGWEKASYLATQAGIRYGTTASQLKLAKQQYDDIAIVFGNALVPALTELMKVGVELAPMIKGLAESFNALPSGVKSTTVAIGGLLIVAGPLLFAIGQISTGIAGLFKLFGIGGAVKIAAEVTKVAAGFDIVAKAAPPATRAVASFFSAPVAIVAAVGAVFTAFADDAINSSRKASEAAIAGMAAAGRVQGEVFGFIRKIQQQGGQATVTEIALAKANLDAFADQIQAEQKRVDEFAKSTDSLYEGGAQLKAAQQNVKTMTELYGQLYDAINKARIEQEKMAGVTGGQTTGMPGVRGYSDSVVPPKTPPFSGLDTPMTPEQLKTYESLVAQLTRQKNGLAEVAKAYAISTAAGQQQSRELEIQTAAFGAADQYAGDFAATIRRLTIEVERAADFSAGEATLADLEQQVKDLDELEKAYRSGSSAVAAMKTQLAQEADVRQRVGKATGDQKKKIEEMAKSIGWRTLNNVVRDSNTLLEDETKILGDLFRQYREGAISLSEFNDESQLQAQIKLETAGLDKDQAAAKEKAIRDNFQLKKSIDQVTAGQRALTRTSLDLAKASVTFSIKASSFSTWDDFEAAVTAANVELEIQAQFLQDIETYGIEAATGLAMMNAQLALFDAMNKKKGQNEDSGIDVPKWEAAALAAAEIGKAFSGLDTTFGRVGEALAKMVVSMADLNDGTKKWQDGLRAAAAIATEFAPETTGGGFGGKGQTNYSGIGSVVGAVIGAVLAAVFTWGTGTSGGAAIGSAIGGAVGSFIVSGADEALGKVEWGASSVGMTFSTMVSKSEADLGVVLKDLGRSIDRQIKGLLDAIGGTIATAAAMDVKVRDGVISVFIAGIVGRFRSMDEAVSFAVTELLKNSNIIGLNETIRNILQKTSADSLDDLADDLSFGMWYDALGIGEIGSQITAAMADLRSKLRKAVEFGLDIGPVVQEALKNFKGLKEQLLGIDTSAVKALEGLASYQLGVQSTIDQLMQGLAETQAALAHALTVQATMSGADKFTDEAGRIIASIPGLQAAVDAYLAQLDAIPKALSDLEISMGIFDALEKYLPHTKKYDEMRLKFAKMKLEIEFASVKAQLILMNRWEEFAQTFTDAYNNALKLLKNPGRGGRNNDKSDVKDFIDDKTFDLATRGMGTYQKMVADITREYDEQIKKAGKDLELRKKLLALKDEELRLLRREITEALIKPYRGGDMDGRRSDFFAQMEGIQKAYDDARATADATGVSVQALNRAERERLELLGLQASAAAGSRTASTILAMRTLGQTMDFLKDNAAALGVNFDALKKEIQQIQFVSLGDKVLGFLDKYYGKVEGFDEFRMDLERARFELDLANMKLEFNMLKSLGLLTEEAINEIAGVFAFIDANPVDWDAFINPADGVSDAVGGVTSSFESMIEALRKSKDGIREWIEALDRGEQGLINPREGKDAAEAQFAALIARARGGDIDAMNAAPQMGTDLIEALKRFNPVYAASQIPAIRAAMASLLGVTTAHDGNVNYSELFASRQATANETLDNGFASLSELQSAQLGENRQAVSELRKISGAYQALLDEQRAERWSDLAQKELKK